MPIDAAKLATLATVTVHAEPDEQDPAGCFATGDDTADARLVRRINRRRNAGDVWAWAVVEVRAAYAGHSASSYLGACSYTDEKDFRQPGGYYDDMRAEVLAELADTLADAAAKLAAVTDGTEADA